MVKNGRFYLSILSNFIESMLSGFNFLILYQVMHMVWDGNLDSSSLLHMISFLGLICIVRLIIYSIDYTKGQIGGAAISNHIRIFLGYKIKRIPLSNITRGQTGDYINVVTNDVNGYEKFLTHRVGDLSKHIAFYLMMILWGGSIWLPEVYCWLG